ncbi:MAG: metallophosphoesterase [Victivallales bacterium]|nr:metallophosphoesterase [Victivallales bacterium]
MERRTFLKLLFGGMLAPTGMRGEEKAVERSRKRDANKVVILSDLHVGVQSGQWQRDGLSGRVSSILAMNPLPSCVLILGDLAYSQGDVEDYRLLKEMLSPLDAAGIPWHPMMGNHDSRDAFFSVFEERRRTLVAGRLVTIVKTPLSDFILLDSLKDGKVSGEINSPQRNWLKSHLAKRTKPVFICAHHSLYDTKLLTLMEQNPCVAGYLHGHLHNWRSSESKKGLPIISAPSTGQWGDIGYVVLTQRADKARVKLTMIDYYYPSPKEPPRADWLERIRQKDGSEVIIPLGAL